MDYVFKKIQWMLKILFILFVLNRFQRVSSIRCGKFGFSCINERCFRKCNVYKRSYVDNFVNVCPEKTFCNEESKRVCSSVGKKDESQDDEIKDIMSTQFSRKHQSIAPPSSLCPLITTTTTPCTTTTTPCTKTTTACTKTTTACTKTTTSCTKTSFCASSPVDKSKKHKKLPPPIKTVKSAFGKHGNCKPNSHSKQNSKEKSKHSRDVWNFGKNELNENAKEISSSINDVSDYQDLLLNSYSEKNADTYDENPRFQNPKSSSLAKQKFICPSVGSFPIKNDDSCFYVCFNRRRSLYTDLTAIKVFCPKTMYFNKISHRCENRSSQYINWRRRRLRNRKFRRQKTYNINKVFK